jgi:hypothetical protein
LILCSFSRKHWQDDEENNGEEWPCDAKVLNLCPTSPVEELDLGRPSYEYRHLSTLCPMHFCYTTIPFRLKSVGAYIKGVYSGVYTRSLGAT